MPVSTRTKAGQCSLPTLILAYVFQSELVAIILALNYANLAKGAFAYYPQEPEVVEIYCAKVSVVAAASSRT